MIPTLATLSCVTVFQVSSVPIYKTLEFFGKCKVTLQRC